MTSRTSDLAVVTTPMPQPVHSGVWLFVDTPPPAVTIDIARSLLHRGRILAARRAGLALAADQTRLGVGASVAGVLGLLASCQRGAAMATG